MRTADAPFVVAAAQASPIFLNRAATVEKACELIVDAGRAGARLVVFPESFIPAYPDWVWHVPPGEERLLNELYAEFLDNSLTIPSPDTDQLCRVAQRARIHVVMGLSERNAEASGASLYSALLFIDAQGSIIGKRRKLAPTGGERLAWAQGDGSTLDVHDTPFGKLGGLIGWENYMPLARYALYAWGAQIYVAATWDRGEPWLSTLRHIAKEGRVFVIGCGMALRQSDIPNRFEFRERFYQNAGEWINIGDSAIVNPDGEFIAGPVREKEEILYATVHPAQMRGSGWMLDVAGHDARPDVFQLTVNREPRSVIQIRREEDTPEIAPVQGRGI